MEIVLKPDDFKSIESINTKIEWLMSQMEPVTFLLSSFSKELYVV